MVYGASLENLWAQALRGSNPLLSAFVGKLRRDKPAKLEASHSGPLREIANLLCLNNTREFDSHRLRHVKLATLARGKPKCDFYGSIKKDVVGDGVDTFLVFF